MQTQKNNIAFAPSLPERLGLCVDRVGGKRALSNMVGISESQLFRYLNGVNEMTSDKLLAVARAAKVDPGWLLSGDGDMLHGGQTPDTRPPFRGELLVQVVQTFEELLTESDKSFTPRQRALAINLIYEALRFEDVRTGAEVTVDKRLTPYYPDYLAPLRADNRMEDYIRVMQDLEYGNDVSTQSLKQFDTLVKQGLTSAYEGSMGEIYFDKMGATLLPEAAKNLTHLVERISSVLGKNEFVWLDAGCGNGRHLAFLSHHFPNLILKGIDISRLALEACNKLVRSGKIAEDMVQLSDMRSLPFTDNSLDVVYCRASLHTLPYVPYQDIGAVMFGKEAQRVLRKHGVLAILTPEGSGRDYIHFTQFYAADDIHRLAGECGLNVLSVEAVPMNETGGTAGKDYSNKLNRGLLAILQKP